MVVFPANWPLVDGFARTWRQFRCLAELTNNPDEDAATSAHDIENVHGDGDLLFRRMRALGFDPAEVVQFWPGILQDLQKTCHACGSRNQCDADLKSVSPDGDGMDIQTWQDYCPNVATLKMLSSLLPAMRA